jgi:hypothetical protein
MMSNDKADATFYRPDKIAEVARDRLSNTAPGPNPYQEHLDGAPNLTSMDEAPPVPPHAHEDEH